MKNQVFYKRLYSEDCYIGLKYQWLEDYTGEFSSIETIDNEQELIDIKRFIDNADVKYYYENL